MLLVLQKSNHIFFLGSKWKPKPSSSQVSLHILQVSDSPSGATAARAACPRKPEGLTLVAVVQKDTQYCMRLMRLNLCFRDDILLFVTPIAECTVCIFWLRKM